MGGGERGGSIFVLFLIFDVLLTKTDFTVLDSTVGGGGRRGGRDNDD